MSAKLRPYAAPATVSLAVIAIFAVIALVASSGAAVAAKQPKCGDKITKDTTLHKDLVNCHNNGILIGADGVNLDLNGHLIDGDETSTKGICDCAVVDEGHDGVTVKNGSVREFDGGVGVLNARHVGVLGISASRNKFSGIFFLRDTRSLVRNSSGSGSGVPGKGGTNGMFVDESHHIRVLDSSFRSNSGHGIFVGDSSHNLIKGNSVSRNNPGEGGILLLGSGRNVVNRNRLSRNGNGIAIQGNRNIIRRNRISRSRGHEGGFGIPVAHGDHNLVARNSIRDTQGAAISVGFGFGADNVVRRNRIRGAGELAGRGIGSRPEAGVLVDRRGRRTLVVGNDIRGGAEDGVHVHGKARHTLLRGNHAFGAKDDGIDVGNPKTKLTRNEARRNGDLGIAAVPGVIDGGGNRASGNGDPRQCTNIVCN
jgi:parallel beta-helix repeat protein